MKILNLFLIFIQFSLCYGVDDVLLLPDPGVLEHFDNNLNINQINPIQELNNAVMDQMKPFSTNLFTYDLLSIPVKDRAIIQGLNVYTINITGQYYLFSNTLGKLKEKYEWIKRMINLHSHPNMLLQLDSIPNYEDLKNKNIKMQNIIISAMVLIQYFINYDNQLDYLNENQQDILNEFQTFITEQTEQLNQNDLTQNQQSTLNEYQLKILSKIQQFIADQQQGEQSHGQGQGDFGEGVSGHGGQGHGGQGHGGQGHGGQGHGGQGHGT